MDDDATARECEHCDSYYTEGIERPICSQCQRAETVLRRLKACEQFRAAVRSQLAPVADDALARDWCLSLQWALRKCGLGGAGVLVLRLTTRRHSEANSWKSVAIKTGMTTEEAKLIYKIALAFFLGELDRRRIPDDYREWKAVA